MSMYASIRGVITERQDRRIGGTLAGGKQAATTNKEIYGEDFYVRIGAIGGRNGSTGGFSGNKDLARRAGKLGGQSSRRHKTGCVCTVCEARRSPRAAINPWKPLPIAKVKKLHAMKYGTCMCSRCRG